MKIIILSVFLCSLSLFSWSQNQKLVSLVPATPSKLSADYFCTWNIQGYAVSYVNSDIMRGAMNEKSMMGKEKYQDWIGLFPTIRQDLIFVMDDSWDIPIDQNRISNNPYLGMVELDQSRFPTFTGNPSERLKKLTDCVKKAGWKGLGGWICAQKAINCTDVPEKEYWIERLKAAQAAGFQYWKIDWGEQSRNDDWRRMISSLGKQYAPNLFIENAMKNEYIEFSDALRTYDVENIIAQPVTIQRICDLLPYKTESGAKGLINCEDEPYIAAGLGCAIGVMRHPFLGDLPNGNKDNVFPAVGRNLKRRLDEVVRGVRWHRIAEPFGVEGAGTYMVDTVKLQDTWDLHKDETWRENSSGRVVGELIKEKTPARVSRGMGLYLPEVADTSFDRPIVLASKYPNGAVSVVTIGRTIGREYVSKKVSVTLKLDDWEAPIGIFGYYKDITFVFSTQSIGKKMNVFAQDLAGDTPVDITKQVKFSKNKLTIPGEVIEKIGLMNATEGDLSDPGLILKFIE